MTAATRGVLALTAATLLGVAVMPGSPRLPSIGLIVLSIAITVAAALGRRTTIAIAPDRAFRLISRSAVGLGAVMFAAGLQRNIDPSSPLAWASLVALSGAVAVAAFASLRDREERRTKSVFLILYGSALLWLLSATPGAAEIIDVALFQKESAIALRDGLNPFAITFVDLYGSLSDRFYGPGVSVDGILQFGFPYLPLSLLAVAPFEWLLSDFRVAHAIAIIATAVVMSRLSDDKPSRVAAVVFLLVAPVPDIVRFGWTEPLVALAAIVVVYSAARRRRCSSYAVGVFISLKQYAVLSLPASLLLLDRPWTRRQITIHIGKVAAVVAATTLPFFLWDPDAFMRSVVELQFIQPFRGDSLGLPALCAIVSILIWSRTPTGAQGFALGSALTLLVAFAFSKQAFANYYFLAIALLCGAAATGGRMVSSRSDVD